MSETVRRKWFTILQQHGTFASMKDAVQNELFENPGLVRRWPVLGWEEDKRATTADLQRFGVVA